VTVRSLLALLVTAALAGCGGGDSGNASDARDSGGSGASYDFKPPPVNTTLTYQQTEIDNAQNNIVQAFTDVIQAVNADGSYTVVQEGSSPAVTVNGTTYQIVTETIQVNNSGQDTSYTYLDTTGQTATCTYNPHGPGAQFPVTVGMTWTLDYTFGCGTQSALSYSQSGSVVDIESVTVPAGTFSAIKFQSTISWTDEGGTTRTQTVSRWRDVSTLIEVQETVSISYSGAMPANGYVVSRTIALHSIS
jgi:hypothetical protein